MKNILRENMRRFRTKNLNEEVDKNALRNISDDLVKRMNNAIDTYMKENPERADGIKKYGRASMEAKPAGSDDIHYYINIPGIKATGQFRPKFEWRFWRDPNEQNLRPGEYIRNVDRMMKIPLAHLNKDAMSDTFPQSLMMQLRSAVSAWARQLRQADISQSTN